MSAFTLRRDDALLGGTDKGDGALSVVFQHGLGGNDTQVAGNMPSCPEFRRLTLECRGHGGSTPGSRRPFSIALFAHDVLAACDARGVGRFVAGGISMGAAIALHLAVRHPDRVLALVLARPAWCFAAAPDNMQAYAEVATLLRRYPPAEAEARFRADATAQRLAQEAPDNLVSLLGFFGRPDPALMADLLSDIAADGPGVSEAEAAALRLPVLVIGHGVDHVHPLAVAEALAAAIPGAKMVQIPPKATDKDRHATALRSALADFLAGLASPAPGAPHLTDRTSA